MTVLRDMGAPTKVGTMATPVSHNSLPSPGGFTVAGAPRLYLIPLDYMQPVLARKALKGSLRTRFERELPG